MIFTHFGISGPLVLDISKDITDTFKNLELVVDLVPDFDIAKLDKKLERILKDNAGKNIANALKELFPQRLADFLIQESKIDETRQCSQTTKAQRLLLGKKIKALKLNIDSLFGFECAIATKGGIDLSEIDSRTMKSKLIDNLFFAGEIIDLLGPCGGFNLQLCWTTGYLAGKILS
jgi:predicted Rossmann fold flavoprotein